MNVGERGGEMDDPPHCCDGLKSQNNRSTSGEGKRLLISEQRLNHKRRGVENVKCDGVEETR